MEHRFLSRVEGKMSREVFIVFLDSFFFSFGHKISRLSVSVSFLSDSDVLLRSVRQEGTFPGGLNFT